MLRVTYDEKKGSSDWFLKVQDAKSGTIEIFKQYIYEREK